MKHQIRDIVGKNPMWWAVAGMAFAMAGFVALGLLERAF
jgi:hypothetical protein